MPLPRKSPTTTARHLVGLAVAPALLALAAAGPSAAAPPPTAEKAQAQTAQRHGGQDTLRRSAPRDLVVGTAVAGGGHHEEQDYADPFAYDVEYRERMAAEFSSLSPENQAKWEYIHPRQDFYNFYPMDAIVRFAQENRQVVRGHTLLWHSQNPEWLEEGDFTDEELRAILKEHIQTVVGRYAGRIQQWDVANEIVKDDGSGLRIGPTSEGGNIWITRLGPGIIADAFRWAHEADPQAKLFLNDYGVEGINPKSTAYYELVKRLKAEGVPVDGFAVQGHLSTQYGFPGDLQANLQRFDALGLETAITELDVRMVLPENGIPTSAQQAQQADYYRRALQACLGVEDCDSFTIWGFTDKYSWVPVFFTEEGSATVMTADYERKPAYHALQSTLLEARRGAGGR
ncbi:endo-1,4-beta-xylanase [Kineococcus sp. SYSU DK006]|uniref:endo-1,4-beta-xylanase n=1 Tax=Kineococcus sp. SYSU DK006 TaxID=3383127 RepID=UPI003D7EA5A5